ncbi:MAG: hypothetical protein V3U36_04700 [Anaerolineales bacterium]
MHARFGTLAGGESLALRERYEQLEARMRAWPRTLENDPFHPGYIDIARNPQEAAQ